MEIEQSVAQLVDDEKIKNLALSTDTAISLDPISNLDFTVIGQDEMNEIEEFIGNTHAKMLNNFSKSQSNYMDTMLVFNAGTDIRNLRQISAEIERKKMALSDNQFKLRKKSIELQKKIAAYNDCVPGLDKDLIAIEIEEMICERNQSRSYIEAALKTILCMKQQFEQILESKGITEVTELDFEKEEEEFHIKKSCHQAFEDIIASGRISVGNNKYLLQLGIMPNLVHDYWIRFLSTPAAYEKQEFLNALDELYQKLKGTSKQEADRRGIKELFYENSVLKIEKM